MLNFNKKKFLDFPERQQHKKCAELLRQIYDTLLTHSSYAGKLANYQELQLWMNLPVLEIINHKTFADRYHYHLKLAHVNIRENNLLPFIRTRDKSQSSPLLPVAIYLDKLRSAFNVGSILRTTEAFALGSVYFSEQTPFIDNRQVQNTSMDTYHGIPCHNNILLEDLPKPVIVMETSPDAISIHDFIFPETFTLVLGNEEYGCSDHAIKQADYLIEIPLYGKKNSLNVANAFAIVAAEIQRQKNFKRDM